MAYHLSREEAELLLYTCTSASDDRPYTCAPARTPERTYNSNTSISLPDTYLYKNDLQPPTPPSPLSTRTSSTSSSTSSSSFSSSSSKKTKGVRFNSQIYQYTYRKAKAAKKALWYSKKEIRHMRTEICALNMSASTMNPHKRGLLIEAYSQADSWRGLEHVREGLLLCKVEHRRNFAQAFLYFTQELGVSDPAALAVFSATKSQLDRRRAMELAKQDALDACQIYYDFWRDENPTDPAKEEQQSTPRRRRRRPSKSTPRHHSERKPFQAQVFNLTLSL